MKQWWRKFRSKHYWRSKFTHMKKILSSSYLIVWNYRTIVWNQLQRVNKEFSHEKSYLIESFLQVWSYRNVLVDVIFKCKIVNVYTVHFEIINDLSLSLRTKSFIVNSLIIFRSFVRRFMIWRSASDEKKKKMKMNEEKFKYLSLREKIKLASLSKLYWT